MKKSDVDMARKLARVRDKIVKELSKAIVGQRAVIDELLIGLFARGHSLIMGVPGLAKTLMVNSLAQILDLEFNRIQFTPDLMPSDITGTDIIEEDRATGKRRFRFVKGPIFAGIVLADEINRTPPKTQAALLQAMQENKVTASGNTYDLPVPFYVLATQNPIEQEGTYPLPEAQLDRFLMMISIEYPSREEEMEIVRSTTSAKVATLERVIDRKDILELQELVRRVPASDHVVGFAVRLAESSRPSSVLAPSYVKECVSWGAGPRASQSLILAGKARALLYGRLAVSVEDVQALALPVMRHRLVLNFNAEASGVTPTTLIERLLEAISPDAA